MMPMMQLLLLMCYCTLPATVTGFSVLSIATITSRSRSSCHEREHAAPSNTCLHNYVRHNNNDFFDDEYERPRRDNPGHGRVNGHDYERVTSPNDNSDVDVDAVNTLLSDRLHARKTGDFDTADRIRDRLSSEHRVTVYDKDKVWEVTHGRGRGGAGGRRHGREGGRGRGGREGGGGGGVRDRAQRKRDTFGPHGHDYTLSREAGPSVVQMPESEIHERIAERLMAKMNRDFETADRIQLLLSEEGIYIDDRRKVWRADGVRFIDVNEVTGRRFRDPQQQQPTLNIPTGPNRPYVQSEFSTPFLTQHDDERFDAIQTLVQTRAAMKVERRYGEADATRDTLQQTFNVVVDDRIREWSMGGSFGHRNDLKRAQDTAIQSRSYSRSQFSQDLQPNQHVTIDDLQEKVNQRTQAKAERRYAESDALRDELRDNFNVIIHDKIKMWSIGGNFGTDDPRKAKQIARRTYVRTGGINGESYLTDAQLVDIQDTLSTRVSAKQRRDFVTSDDLRAYLYDTYNININDDEREWRVLEPELPVGGFVQGAAEPGATRLNYDEVTTVENLLVERIQCQKQRAFDTADDLKDYLARTYSVVIDDKAKEWKVVASSRNNDKESPSRDSQEKSRSSRTANVNSRQIFDASRGNKGRNDHKTIATIDVDVNADAGSIDETVTATKSEPKAVVESDSNPLLSLSKDRLTALTVVMLKKMLREAGKPVSGKKSVLIDRLLS